MRAEVLLPAKIHYPGFICKFSKYYFCKIKPYDAANKDTEICLDEVLVVSLYSEVTKRVYFIGNERMLIAHDSNRLRFS